MNSHKIFLALIVATSLLFAGCLGQPQNAVNSTQADVSPASEAGLIGDITNLGLTANETGFEITDQSDLSPGENGTTLEAAGFDKGFSVGLAKYDDKNFERIVHQVTRYNTSAGAGQAFEETRKVISESSEIVSELNLPKLGEKQFGVKGTRTVDLGVKGATIDDYIIVFVKSNVLVAVDYFGLQESVSEQKALQFTQMAASKFNR